MKKPMEQMKEMVQITEEQSDVKNMSKELENVKKQIKNLLKFIKVFAVIMILFAAYFCIDCIIDVVRYVQAPAYKAPAAAIMLGESILSLISVAEYTVIAIICKNIFESIDKSYTPFIPQVPKGMRKIAFTVIAAFCASITAEVLYNQLAGTEISVYIDGTKFFLVSILMLLSCIFDYGCKLQQESDETL